MRTPLAGHPDSRHREPLWDRVDRNRMRLVLYLVMFALLTSLLLTVTIALIAASTFLTFDDEGNASSLQLIGHWVFSDGLLRPWLLSVFIAVVYEVWALARKERWLLDRLGATFVPKGEWLPTKMALKDMAIAGGLQVAPSLWALDTSNVNAFVFAAPGHRPVVGVTHGLVTRLSVAQQRAVFANLVARIVSADIAVSSTVASLLAPLQWYRAHRLNSDDEEDARLLTAAAEVARTSPNTGNMGCAIVPFILAAFPAVIAAELLAAVQRRSHLIASEKADAEGMLLLKDPRVMLSALERSIRLNNNVLEADEALGDLFYCWTGDSTDDESDPEWHRVARLREVLGVEGRVEQYEVPDMSGIMPPPAPRLEE